MTDELQEEQVSTPAEAVADVAQVPAAAGRPVQTVGRRKEAVVRVRLVPGSGEFKLNGKTLEQYFPNKVHQQVVREPLVTVDRVDNFDVVATLRGGGPSGQAGALRMAIARPAAYDPDDRPALKKAGMLTRRPREGTQEVRPQEGPARPQYSKR